MRKLPYKSWVLAGALMLAPLVGHSAGLGKLTMLSALGQPLSAEIDLVSVQKDEVSSLAIRLAPPEAFTKANIVFSPALIGARLSIEKRADGQSYAKITSSRAINEPFISILVELSWSRGRLVREYTALIDPPNVPATTPAAAVATPVAPAVTAPKAVPAPEAAPIATAPAAPAAPESKPAAAAPAVKPAAAPAAAKSADRQYGPVKRGETLAKIAANVKPEGVTLEQTLLGLYRSNPEAFSGNMNRLKSGQILRVPEREQLVETAPQDALKEVRVQAANWNAYRQKIADAAGDTPASESRSVARGKIAPVEDKAAAKEAPKEVVKLSKGDATPGNSKAGKGGSAKDRMRALEDEATVREKALAEANDRIAQLEKNIKDMQRLLELKGVAPGSKPDPAKADAGKAAPAKAEPPKAEPAKAEPPKEAAKAEPAKDAPKADPAKAEPAKDAVAVEPAKDAEKSAEAPKAEAPPAPKPKPKPVAPPPPSPEPDLLDQLTSDPLYMAGGAGVLAILGIGGYVFVRRRRAKSEDDDEAPVAKGKVATAAAASAAPMAVAPVVAQASVDDVDPLAEADLYLNFGRDTQAEEVLKDALAKNPNHEEAKLKLLQIYAGRKDKDSFEKVAKDLHLQTSGSGDNWIKAAGMGYALDPENLLYEAGRSAPAAELPAASGPAGTDLDFDLELAPDGTATGTKTDFDVDGGKTVMMQPGELAGLAGLSETQDVTSDSGAARAVADSAAASPDFTLNIPAGQPIAGAEPDLTLDATPPAGDDMTQSNVSIDAGTGGNMIDFNFDSTAMTAPVPDAAPAPEMPAFSPNSTVVMTPENQENAGGLNVDFDLGKSAKVEVADAPLLPDLNLDLPTDAAPAAEAAEAMLPELKLDDISLNFELPKTDEPAAAAAPALAEGGAKDDRWYDVQTKFDLAKAYQEMGDKDGAREILQEVIKDGDAAQQAEAKALLDSLT